MKQKSSKSRVHHAAPGLDLPGPRPEAACLSPSTAGVEVPPKGGVGGDAADSIFGEGYKENLIKRKRELGGLRDPNLMNMILAELSRDHLLDDKEKMTGFLIVCTAYLPDVNDRKSIAYVGDSCIGKDNLMHTLLKHFPLKDWIFLTHATQATLQDDITKLKIIAFSEFNVGTEGGANAHLIETVKQMTEGGTSALKKDVMTGYKLTKHEVQEQKTVLYSTTEERRDDQLETRFIIASMKGYPAKTRTVNDNTLNATRDLDRLTHHPMLNVMEKEEAWLQHTISKIVWRPVYFPYADLIKEWVDDQDPRSMRDLKRLLSVVKVIANLYQKQRQIRKYHGKDVIISHPLDFLNAWSTCGKCFNQTYSGLGERLRVVLDCMDRRIKASGVKAVKREDIQAALRIKTKKTTKARMKMLEDMGLVRYAGQDGNSVLFERGEEGGNRGLMGVKIQDMIRRFAEYKPEDNDLFDTPHDPLDTPLRIAEDEVFLYEKENDEEGGKFMQSTLSDRASVLNKEITPLELPPLIDQVSEYIGGFSKGVKADDIYARFGSDKEEDVGGAIVKAKTEGLIFEPKVGLLMALK